MYWEIELKASHPYPTMAPLNDRHNHVGLLSCTCYVNVMPNVDADRVDHFVIREPWSKTQECPEFIRKTMPVLHPGFLEQSF